MGNTEKSEQAFAEAQHFFPGGVNSPVRAFRSVGRNPLFIDRAKGAYVYDLDGNAYVDYVLSWGPMIAGHANDEVVSAIQQTAVKGTSFGAPTPLETELAQLIQHFLPSMEMMRMVSSGTEAAMSAIRLARGVTGKEKIVKFKGCYHGHSDSFLVNAGSGAATFELENSPGVPSLLSQLTLSVDFNDLPAVEKLFADHKDEIAAVIVEPIAGNMGLIPGTKDFLAGLRRLTEDNDALLIFDEVMTGFRCDIRSAQGLYGIEPDLTTLGKVVGGGLPAAVFGGKRKFMEEVAPVGSVYQAGTLSGNPLAMSAGIAALKQLDETKYLKMEKLGRQLTAGLAELASEYSIPVQANYAGTMWGFFFNSKPVRNFSDAKASNQKLFAEFYRGVLEKGIYLAPSQFESNFLSTAHTEKEVVKTLTAFETVFSHLKKSGA